MMGGAGWMASHTWCWMRLIVCWTSASSLPFAHWQVRRPQCPLYSTRLLKLEMGSALRGLPARLLLFIQQLRLQATGSRGPTGGHGTSAAIVRCYAMSAIWAVGMPSQLGSHAGGTRADRQTLMFSATWPASIQRLAAEFQCQPVRVTIGSADLSASHSVAQVGGPRRCTRCTASVRFVRAAAPQRILHQSQRCLSLPLSHSFWQQPAALAALTQSRRPLAACLHGG